MSRWEPDSDELQATSIWSFPNRGSWATHSGKYPGNWSPYIPRNIIKRYSQQGEVVLDGFAGSGTTLIEAKLLERRSIGVDINPVAINLSRRNLEFPGKAEYEPMLICADSRNLDFIKSDSVDLVCTHPPYANIIKYSTQTEGDISLCEVDEFLINMKEVSKELFRVLKPNGICAFLIGDMRKNKNVVSLGFNTLQVFEESGFVLKEIVIKEQHNCRSTSKWQVKGRKLDFLLLAHEYLFILKK